jgi:hypothetical protein
LKSLRQKLRHPKVDLKAVTKRNQIALRKFHRLHNCFHINERILKVMNRKNANKGAGINYDEIKLQLPKYITCLRAKFRRFLIKRNPLRVPSTYQKLCSDIIYSRKKSINGNYIKLI